MMNLTTWQRDTVTDIVRSCLRDLAGTETYVIASGAIAGLMSGSLGRHEARFVRDLVAEFEQRIRNSNVYWENPEDAEDLAAIVGVIDEAYGF